MMDNEDGRVCTSCGEHKPASGFYVASKQSGTLRPTCKACFNSAFNQYRRDNRAKINAMDRDYRLRNPDKQRAIDRRYTESHGLERSARSRAWRARDPRRNKAHAAVDTAIRRGDLIRPDRCGECGRVAMIHAHHDDYAESLVIRWLCARCHRLLHKDHKAAEAARKEKP